MSSTRADTLLRGGAVVTAEASYAADVAIAQGKIAAIGAPSWMPEADETIDVAGKLIFPGVIDPTLTWGSARTGSSSRRWPRGQA